MNSKGGKREGSGRKAIEGKEIKVKLPNEVINEIDDLSEGNTLAEKVRNAIVKSLSKRKNKKLEVLDLFCGAGGLSYGFKLAGFSIVGGVEWDKAAMETHSTNFKSKFEFCGDISLRETKHRT